MRISVKLFAAFHIWVYRLSKGRVMGQLFGGPVLLLTTTGRKSGKRRTLPLIYTADGDRYLLVASAGGAPQNPAWYHNLVANAMVTVEVRGRRFQAKAESLSPEDREQAWPKVVATYSGYDRSQQNTSRVIPVVALMVA